MSFSVVRIIPFVFGLLLPIASLSQDKTASQEEKAPGGKAKSLQGIYLVKGKMKIQGQSKAYLGTAIILKRKDTYHIEWRVGQDSFFGVGIQQGKQMGATWASVKNGQLSAGTLLYQIEKGEKGPHLIGKWTGFPGGGPIHEENLIFVEPPSKEMLEKEKKRRLKEI